MAEWQGDTLLARRRRRRLPEQERVKPKGFGGSNPSASAKSRDRVVAQLTSLISWAGQKPDAGSNPAPATSWSL